MGNKNSFTDMNSKNISGKYDVSINNEKYVLKITGKSPKFKAELKKDTLILASKMTFKEDWLNIYFSEKESKSYTRLIAKISEEKKSINGKAILADGTETTFIGNYSELVEKKKRKKRRKEY
jgi:hypothetical protein